MAPGTVLAVLRFTPPVALVLAGLLAVIGAGSAGSAALDTARAARRAVGRARRRRQLGREFAAIAAAEADVFTGRETAG